MSERISVLVDEGMDVGLRARTTDSDSKAAQLRRLLNKHGASATPLLPRAYGVAGEHAWHVSCGDGEAASMVAELLQLKGVLGAHVIPDSSVPTPS